jgi:hypothetical protein
MVNNYVELKKAPTVAQAAIVLSIQITFAWVRVHMGIVLDPLSKPESNLITAVSVFVALYPRMYIINPLCIKIKYPSIIPQYFLNKFAYF